MAGFRGELTETGLVQAIRDIYNFFYDATGERYTKTLLSDAFKIFVPDERLTRPVPYKLVLG